MFSSSLKASAPLCRLSLFLSAAMQWMRLKNNGDFTKKHLGKCGKMWENVGNVGKCGKMWENVGKW